MIDIHSHIIPGIDDGSKNIKMTIDMLKRAQEDGTTDIVATPHFFRGYGEAPYSEVKDLAKHFNELAKEEGLNINIHYGQEVYYSESLLNDFKEGLIGTINDSKYMLIELDMREFDRDVLDTIYELQVMGIQPIIAHPERYRYIINDPSMINRFIKEGALFQMNAGSIIGNFGQRVKKTAEVLLDKEIYSFIGSDAHNDINRTTGISQGINAAADRKKIYRKLFNENGYRLINNEEVKFNGELVKEKKKGLFSFLSY